MDRLWHVYLNKQVQKRIRKMPQREQTIMTTLLDDLKIRGPVLPDWPNFSKLGKQQYHCHLSYKWVACWEVINQDVRLMEVYYAGSREDAPY